MLLFASAAFFAVATPDCGGGGAATAPANPDAGAGAGGSGGEAGAGAGGEAGGDGNHEFPPPPATCGNKKLEGIEQCDDGNTQNGDGCSALCSSEACDTCRYGNCNGDEATSGCGHLQEQERNSCLEVLYCVLASQCAKGSKRGGSECYCGPDDCLGDAGSVAPVGACVEEIQRAAGSDVSAVRIAAELRDSTTPLGSAFMLIGCELAFCETQCF